MDEAKKLALRAKGYDVVFEHGGDTIAINSKEFTEEKERQLEKQFGLKTFRDENLVFYNPEDWLVSIDSIRHVGKSSNPSIPHNLENMGHLFQNSGSQTLDLNNWDTSVVTDMYAMFYDCSSLQSLDLSKWSVSKVENMRAMFSACSSLQSLDLSRWNVSKVEDMYAMFSVCSSLQSLDLREWDVSRVECMCRMFCSCSSLQSLDLREWDVSRVEDMSAMFYNCSSLQSLDLSRWDVSKVKSIASMFTGCNSLKEVILGPKSLNLKEQIELVCPQCRVTVRDCAINAF